MAKAADYIEDVRRYDAGASETVVQKIVDHLGSTLNSKDGSLVACSDQKEKDQIVKSWCEAKLGLSGDCSKIVDDICALMKEDHNKQRVTFYYLVAQHIGLLGQV